MDIPEIRTYECRVLELGDNVISNSTPEILSSLAEDVRRERGAPSSQLQQLEQRAAQSAREREEALLIQKIQLKRFQEELDKHKSRAENAERKLVETRQQLGDTRQQLEQENTKLGETRQQLGYMRQQLEMKNT